jgi:hypothetical protein
MFWGAGGKSLDRNHTKAMLGDPGGIRLGSANKEPGKTISTAGHLNEPFSLGMRRTRCQVLVSPYQGP